jgi:mono/diheme cytochrome c family protein
MPRFALFALSIAFPISLAAAELTPAQRGKKALEETAFIAPSWLGGAFDDLWKQWGLPAKPKDYTEQALKRYGLHPAPYPNQGLPMGLRNTNFLFVKGVAVDCMLCHGGSVLGKSYVGLGNTSLDIETLFSELNVAEGRPPRLPFTFSNVRGTTEAGAFAVYLLGYREPDLKVRTPRVDLGLKDNLCEDVPAWWLLKKKKTMYFTGEMDARSVRSKMQFMMSPITSPQDFARHEAAFVDVQEYLLSIEAPKYPFPIDGKRAESGKAVFVEHCAKCHGTYGEKWTYPNKVIPIAEIGTDPKRYEGVNATFGAHYNRSWFAQEKSGWFLDDHAFRITAGYQAPPLDGVWSTAPYFHNASVPTLDQVLNSKDRPQRFTRSYSTDESEYDQARVGWKYTTVPQKLRENLAPLEKRKIYDTTLPGRSNGGHQYGDQLSDEERKNVIEYLKTL